MATSNVKLLGALPSSFTLQVQLALNINSVKYGAQVPPSSLLIPMITPSPFSGHPIFDQKFFPPLEVIGATQDEKERTVAIKQVVVILVLLEEAFVKCSEGKAFFGGDNIGYLDITFGCSLPWLRMTEKRRGVQLL
ncbi:glutathione S-transferase U17-like [Cornus florida]|uniref:glutathione S-transferase U17-like n=1 Tax=Cornus florida TaxID=4283 RepID=UPI00289FE369|nr:glutathione S-transferase U17-like [Cornus florida]